MPASKPVAVQLFRVCSPFITFENGREIPYLCNDTIYTADHHAVKKHRGNFVEVFPEGPLPRQKVEQATAAPGEER